MQYKGEFQNWSWDKHCKKFNHQIQVIDKWATAGLATLLSGEDKISAFLKMIPKDCKNRELGISQGIIEGDRSWFPTLIGTVISHLSLSMSHKSRVHPMPNALLPMPVLTMDGILASTRELHEVPVQQQGSYTLKAEKWWGPLSASIMRRTYGWP